MSPLRAPLIALGERALAFCARARELGRFYVALLQAALRGPLDGTELLQALDRVGVRALPIIATTALFAGAITVLQVGTLVVQLQAFEVLGWGFGFSLFREIAPLLIGLMFSGRVGAHDAAQLGTMAVTEQIDALRILAIEPVAHLALPRVLAMTLMMAAHYVIGCAFALAGGALTAQLLTPVDAFVFWRSLLTYVHVADFLSGLLKCLCFGALIGSLSCAFGFSTTGGAAGVGRSVNASVVAAAVAIFILDSLLTVFGP